MTGTTQKSGRIVILNTGAEDTDTGGIDVDNGPKVCEGARKAGADDGPDSQDARRRGGRVVGRVLVVIAGRHGHGHAVNVDGNVDGFVDARVQLRAQADVDDGAVGNPKRLRVPDGEIDARQELSYRALAVDVEHLDGHQRCLLGDPVGRTAHGACHMRAVAELVRVGRTGYQVRAPDGAAWLEFLVGAPDARVHDVHSDAVAGRVVVEVVGGFPPLLVRNACQAPVGDVLLVC